MSVTFWIGIAAATLTTCSFLPQAIQTFKTKDTSGISLTMYLLFVTGIVLWLIYGIILKEPPLIIANTITLTLSASILYMKIKSLYR